MCEYLLAERKKGKKKKVTLQMFKKMTLKIKLLQWTCSSPSYTFIILLRARVKLFFSHLIFFKRGLILMCGNNRLV